MRTQPVGRFFSQLVIYWSLIKFMLFSDNVSQDISVYAAESTGEVMGDANADESEKIKELVSGAGAGGWSQQ